MKKSIIILFTLSLGLMLTAQSCSSSSAKNATENQANQNTVEMLDQETTETFMVYGNCGMCKNTIEKAANSIKGVSSANWDKETHIISVNFDSKVTSLADINQAIADSGYDTANHRATDSVYNNLPGCCQYERPIKKK